MEYLVRKSGGERLGRLPALGFNDVAVGSSCWNFLGVFVLAEEVGRFRTPVAGTEKTPHSTSFPGPGSTYLIDLELAAPHLLSGVTGAGLWVLAQKC